MLSDWLPNFCTRLNIFLSYSSEYRPIAEKIAQTLTNDGHTVFFDKESLPPAGDYNERIRKAVRYSDRFLFLASHSALERGKYTLTELDYAQKAWPSPVGRVFPVIVDPELKPESLPTYLSTVQALDIEGNAPAEIAAAIERTGEVKLTCSACLVVSTLALAGVLGLATGVIPLSPGFRPADIALVEPEYVHFRPRARPPDNPSAPGADTNWIKSPVTITAPIAYSHRNANSAPAQVVREQAMLQLGDLEGKYTWTYIVEIVFGAISETKCKKWSDWLCQTGNVKVENLSPGKSTSQRETMFMPIPGKRVLWKELIDTVLNPEGPKTATVVIRSEITVADGSNKSDLSREFICNIDVAGVRQRMLSVGYKPGQNPRPATWQPRCKNN